MHIVFKTLDGEIQWDEKLEVESIESFVDERNKRVLEMGSKRATYYMDSPRQVTQTEWNGKTKGTYHLCEAIGCKLI